MSLKSLPGTDNITRTVLDNGITVLVYENHAAQSVVLFGVLNNGGLFAEPAKNGLAAMTASSLMRGTRNRDFDAIHASLENIGADLQISARQHKTSFGGKGLAEDLPTLVDVLADALRNPSFPEQQVERLRGEMMTWLQYAQNDTRYRAGRAFRESLYPPEHPYHYGVSGTLETLPGLSIGEIEVFHRKHYGPKGMIIIVTGAVNAQEAIDTVREKLGDWENPEQPDSPPLPSLAPLQEKRHTKVVVNGKTQSDIVLGVAGPSRYAEDFSAASLANSVLGVFGMMGRIGNIIREELGLAYYAYSQLTGGYGPGVWSVIAGVNPDNVDEAVERSQAEVRRIASELVSDEDLADNQSFFTGRLPLQLESNEGIAGRILMMESFGLGLDYLVNYHNMIYSLTKDDLLATIQRYWRPEAFVVAVAGPGEE